MLLLLFSEYSYPASTCEIVQSLSWFKSPVHLGYVWKENGTITFHGTLYVTLHILWWLLQKHVVSRKIWHLPFYSLTLKLILKRYHISVLQVLPLFPRSHPPAGHVPSSGSQGWLTQGQFLKQLLANVPYPHATKNHSVFYVYCLWYVWILIYIKIIKKEYMCELIRNIIDSRTLIRNVIDWYKTEEVALIVSEQLLNIVKLLCCIPLSHFFSSPDCLPGLHAVVSVQTPCSLSNKHPSHDSSQL